MRKRGTEKDRCLNCGKTLKTTRKGPCPKCGDTRRAMFVSVANGISVSDSAEAKRIREWITKHPKAFVVTIGFTIISSVVGLVIGGLIGALVGLAIGVICIFALPATKTKNKEIT